MKNAFHKFIRWMLGLHGIMHVVETGINLWEGAWLSAATTAFMGFIMLAGAYIDADHHKH